MPDLPAGGAHADGPAPCPGAGPSRGRGERPRGYFAAKTTASYSFSSAEYGLEISSLPMASLPLV